MHTNCKWKRFAKYPRDRLVDQLVLMSLLGMVVFRMLVGVRRRRLGLCGCGVAMAWQVFHADSDSDAH